MMAISTHSKFYYGHTIDTTNNAIDFDEGGAELHATLTTGEYTLTEFAAEVGRAMTEAGGQTYTASVNRTTRIITVSATSNFSLLVSSGTRSGTAAWTLLGFSGADKTGTNTYTGSAASGSSYSTQFKLQSYTPSANFMSSADATVNKSASGKVQVVRFGEERFVEFELKFITNTTMPSGAPIRTDASGLSNLQDFMDYLITKAPIEFMADEDTPSSYQKLILESTDADKNGVGYKIKEMYDKGLPGFYDTGLLKFRVVT